LSFSDQLAYALADDSCELPFCTKDTIDECLSYLNQVFIMLSLKPRLHNTTCCQTGCQAGLTTG